MTGAYNLLPARISLTALRRLLRGAPLFIGKTFNCSLDSVCTGVFYSGEDIAHGVFMCAWRIRAWCMCVSMANTLPRACIKCRADFIFSLVCPPCAVYGWWIGRRHAWKCFSSAARDITAEGNSCCGKRGCRKFDPCYDENIDCNFLERKYIRWKGKRCLTSNPLWVKVDANWLAQKGRDFWLEQRSRLMEIYTQMISLTCLVHFWKFVQGATASVWL